MCGTVARRDRLDLPEQSVDRAGVARLISKLDLPDATRPPRFATISPVTTAAAVECGLTVDAEATVHNWEGLLDAIVRATQAEK